MQNQKKKTATGPTKARRNTQPKRPAGPPLLTVTLDAKASACVRRFAEEFGEDVRDVASGSILDTLPQALEEWEDTKRAREQGKHGGGDYWQDTSERGREARKRRGAKQTPARGAALPPGGPLTLTLSLRGLTHQAYLAMCKSDDNTPLEWLKETVCEGITEFFTANLEGQDAKQFTAMLAGDVETES